MAKCNNYFWLVTKMFILSGVFWLELRFGTKRIKINIRKWKSACFILLRRKVRKLDIYWGWSAFCPNYYILYMFYFKKKNHTQVITYNYLYHIYRQFASRGRFIQWWWHEFCQLPSGSNLLPYLSQYCALLLL